MVKWKAGSGIARCLGLFHFYAMHRLLLDPLPCPRPRIAVRGKFPTAYYPASYQTWKNEAAKLLTERRPAETFSGPLKVNVRFEAQRPKTTKLAHPKPDIDNYLKSLFDALTQSGWWDDDCQVVQVSARKCWTANSDDPGRILFSIEEISNEDDGPESK